MVTLFFFYIDNHLIYSVALGKIAEFYKQNEVKSASHSFYPNNTYNTHG